MLKVENLSFHYGERQILQHVALRLEQGEIGCLIGASGSGKSTIFKLLTGLLPAQEGKIFIAGQPLPLGRANVAYMMQEDLLLPWRSVLSNLTLTSELGRDALSAEELKKEALELLMEMGLSQCCELFPEQLSGGMRQRVSLARALLQKRPLLLLDEPFGSLDVSLREQMYALLRRIQAKMGMTMLLVTHDFRDALSLANHVFLLAHHRIHQEWRIQEKSRHDPVEAERLMKEMRLALQESAPV